MLHDDLVSLLNEEPFRSKCHSTICLLCRQQRIIADWAITGIISGTDPPVAQRHTTRRVFSPVSLAPGRMRKCVFLRVQVNL